jgi:hypothetical protein
MITTKRIATLVVLVTLAASCKEVSFKEPQPKGVKAINQVPKHLQGSYAISDDKGATTDTLVITNKGFYARSQPKDFRTLGDSLIMKSYKGYYFISKDEHPEWVLRVVKQENNGDLYYMSMQYGNDFHGFLRGLGREITIDSSRHGSENEKLYQIDPSPKKLMELMDKGYFTKTVLKKISPTGQKQVRAR